MSWTGCWTCSPATDDLRLSRDRPQQARGRALPGPGGGLRRDRRGDPPPGAIVVFSAHGIPPASASWPRARGLHAIDATCPLVTKVHSEAIRYARQGYQILLVGHADHQEVIGTTGRGPRCDAGGRDRPEDIPATRASHDPERLVYLTQTTLSTRRRGGHHRRAQAAVSAIKSRRARTSATRPPTASTRCARWRPRPTWCSSSGSTNSSNSVRLTEIARNVGTPARLIDDASGLRDEWFPRAVRRC
jgi:4-hydroxy-3-methylbut-2-enyl diphosphate reductase